MRRRAQGADRGAADQRSGVGAWDGARTGTWAQGVDRAIIRQQPWVANAKNMSTRVMHRVLHAFCSKMAQNDTSHASPASTSTYSRLHDPMPSCRQFPSHLDLRPAALSPPALQLPSSLARLQVIATLAEKGDIQALIAYTGSTGQKLDYMFLLQSLLMNNPNGAVALAKMVAKQNPPPLDTNVMADLFLQVRPHAGHPCMGEARWSCPRCVAGCGA